MVPNLLNRNSHGLVTSPKLSDSHEIRLMDNDGDSWISLMSIHDSIMCSRFNSFVKFHSKKHDRHTTLCHICSPDLSYLWRIWWEWIWIFMMNIPGDHTRFNDVFSIQYYWVLLTFMIRNVIDILQYICQRDQGHRPCHQQVDRLKQACLTGLALGTWLHVQLCIEFTEHCTCSLVLNFCWSEFCQSCVVKVVQWIDCTTARTVRYPWTQGLKYSSLRYDNR